MTLWIQRLIDWLFNGTSTQKGNFMAIAREGNLLKRLRMANEKQCIIRYVIQQRNTVHGKTFQLHKRNNRLSNQTNYLLITLAPSLIPSQILHTLFEIIPLGVDAILCHDQDTCKTVNTCALHVAKCHIIISWIMYRNFPTTGFGATVCASTWDNRIQSTNSFYWSCLPLNNICTTHMNWSHAMHIFRESCIASWQLRSLI